MEDNSITQRVYRIWVSTAICVIVFLLFCLSPNAQGYNPYYLPLTQAELAKRIPQKKYLCPETKSGEQVQVGIATIKDDDGSLLISGKDKTGHPWEVSGLFSYWGCELYTADLDRNGIQDLIVVTYNSANGSAPNVELGILLFEPNGRPVFTNFVGYFETDALGVKDFIDLNHDGRAELLCQSFDDGYWITSLYEARDAHWFPVHGGRGSRTFPLYTRFTYRHNHIATNPEPGRNPRDADLSNSAILDQTPVTIEKVLWETNTEGLHINPKIVLSDGRMCSADTLIVVDQEAGRQSEILAPDDSRNLLETIMRNKLPVWISGHMPPRWGKISDCLPELIWAGTAPHR